MNNVLNVIVDLLNVDVLKGEWLFFEMKMEILNVVNKWL